MPNDRDKQSAGIKRLKKSSQIAAGLFLLYVIIGFGVIPPLVKPKLEENLSGLLGRKVTIGEIKINPLVLSATVSGLTVYEIDEQPFAGFEELYANAQLSSIIKMGAIVREIRVQGPFGVLKLLPDNKMNIDDILTKLSTPEPEAAEKSELPQIVIAKLQVDAGKLTVENLSGKEPAREEIAPISFELENLSTLKDRQGAYHFEGVGPIGGKFEIDGKITVDPLWIQGSYHVADIQISHYWEHIKDLVAFQIIGGTAQLTGNYAVETAADQIKTRIENGTFKLDDFKLAEKGQDDVLIAIPAFSVQGIGVDLEAREVEIASVQTADASIKSWLAADGTFALQKLLLPDQGASKEKADDDPVSEKAPSQPWLATIGKVEIRNWGAAFEDRTLAKAAKLSLNAIDVGVENLTNRKDSPANLVAAMQINQAGRIRAEGTAGIDPPQADLKFVTAKIGLKPFQPYVDEAVKAQIATGSASSTGRIRYHGRDAQPQIRYEGEFSVDDVKIQDRIQNNDFITLAQFRAGGIALELLPNKLKASEVLIDRPQGMITIDQAGVVNVVEAFAPVEKQEGGDEENLLQRLVNLLILQFKGPMPMQVDLIRLERFTVDFTDASISPTFSTHVEISEGRFSGLSSDPSTQADFKLNGSIDRTATIQGSGEMNPMNALQYSKVELSLKDFALKPVSPYSGKFIGYKINQGTLHTDLRYQVADDAVKGNNIIRIDQLELGEKVDSPDAPNLPIKLAVSLLKDRKGRITVKVPVVGSARDPQFDSAAAIKSALRRTVEEAGSDPFTTITEVDGFTGEDLRVVAFDFGLADLPAPETQKLNALAKYLKARDTLSLGIAGTADRQMDGAALTGTPPAKPASSDNASLASAAGPTVDDKHLEKLARKRAERVSAYLVDQAGIEARRVQLKPVQIKPTPDGDKAAVAFSLSVE
jgi:outer membrane protein OmpA-like peptidoglycan-associated protein